MRKKLKKAKMKFVGVLIEEDLHEQIIKQAKAEGGTVSFLVRRACHFFFDPKTADAAHVVKRASENSSGTAR